MIELLVVVQLYKFSIVLEQHPLSPTAVNKLSTGLDRDRHMSMLRTFQRLKSTYKSTRVRILNLVHTIVPGYHVPF